MSSGPPGRIRVQVSTTANDNEDQATQPKFNFEDLLHVLYGKKQASTVDLLQLQKERKKERTKTYCVVCHVDRPPNGCPFHEPSSTYTADRNNSLSYAIKSFPAEVQLCTSSIPGAIFGVCAKRVIPEGTWIGPYEGRRVSPEELSVSRNNPYVWEICEDGQPSYYIDGSDESASSWMRFIRCARHKEEQNLYAFQYLGNIFYRSFKEIPKGTEMLVWYDDKYPQHLGIPTGLQEIEFISSSDLVGSSSGAKVSNTASKNEGDSRHKVDQEKDEVKEMDISRSLKDYNPRLAVHPAESRQRVMATPSPHRLRHSSYLTRISCAPHSLSSSPGFPTPEMSSISSPAIPYATVAPHYTLPNLPIVPPLQSNTPAGVYGVAYRHHMPVNISAGIPVSISGRGQLGITGTHLPRVHQEVLEEGPIITSSDSVVYNDRQYRPTSSISPTLGKMDRESYLQRKRAFYSSTTANPDASDEAGHPKIVMSKRKATEVTTIDSDSRQYPPLTKRKSPLSFINEEGSVENETGRSNRPRTPKERLTDDQGSERNRSTKSHRLHLSKEEHASQISRVTSAWPSDESQSQDEAAGESSDSNSTSSTKNETAGIDEISMWRCRQCQKTFTQRVMLQVHVCPQQPLKPYRCGQCELSFATATELRSHVETHASEKPFKCGFCSRSFAGATTLNNHIRTHMGKRPFSCEHCGKGFAQAGQLARHQRTPGECEPRTTKV